VTQRGDRVVVSFSWADKAGTRHQWAQALTLENGKIIDIQDYAKPAAASAAVRLRTLFA
jgi:hypothetical protein